MANLYVVSTPIGNLKDITLRALEVLKQVNYIACEDTRQTKKLLNHYGITGKKLLSYYEPKEEEKAEKILQILKSEDVALVSDAGTPTISDPGYKLIKKAIENGIKVIPVPGVSAVITALSASGLPTDRFVFYGFFPKQESKKVQILKQLQELEMTGVFYESPNRVLKTLQTINEVLPDADVVVAKELTKVFEEFVRGSSQNVLRYFEENQDKLKGEFVILVYPPEKKESEEEVLDIIKKLKSKGLSTKEIAKEVAQKTGIPKKKAYQMVLKADGES